MNPSASTKQIKKKLNSRFSCEHVSLHNSSVEQKSAEAAVFVSIVCALPKPSPAPCRFLYPMEGKRWLSEILRAERAGDSVATGINHRALACTESSNTALALQVQLVVVLI